MKDFRFYADYGHAKGKRQGGDAPNCLALHTDPWYSKIQDHEIITDCIAATFSHPNSGVCTTGVSRGYLREACKRISEAEARRMHPSLFAFLATCEHAAQAASINS